VARLDLEIDETFDVQTGSCFVVLGERVAQRAGVLRQATECEIEQIPEMDMGMSIGKAGTLSTLLRSTLNRATW
jgi:hypothetical protein